MKQNSFKVFLAFLLITNYVIISINGQTKSTLRTRTTTKTNNQISTSVSPRTQTTTTATTTSTTRTTTTTSTTPTTTSTTTTTTTQKLNSTDIADNSLKKTLVSYFDQNYEILKKLGLVSNSFIDEYTSDFCTKNWKNYKSIKTFNLSTDINIFSFQQNLYYTIVKDDYIIWFYQNNTNNPLPSPLLVKTFNFLNNSFGPNLLNFIFNSTSYLYSKGIAVDSKGFTYVTFLVYLSEPIYNYRIYVYKYDMNFSLVKSTYFTQYFYFKSISIDRIRNQIYLVSDFTNVLFVFDESLNKVNLDNNDYKFYYSGMQPNGRFMVKADGSYIVKFNQLDLILHNKKINSNLPSNKFYTPWILINECIFVALNNDYSKSLEVYFLHINGQESYSFPVEFSNYLDFYRNHFVSYDGKVFVILYNYQTAQNYVIKLDYILNLT